MTAPQKIRTELLIWWTTDNESVVIGETAPDHLPAYVRQQYLTRVTLSRGQQKALLVDARFGTREIRDWPDTNIARAIRDGSDVGIVFSSGDLLLFKHVPLGLVTDFKLQVLVP